LLQPDRLVEAGAEPGTTVYGAYRLQLTMDPET
jgi:hypothetical protein